MIRLANHQLPKGLYLLHMSSDPLFMQVTRQRPGWSVYGVFRSTDGSTGSVGPMKLASHNIARNASYLATSGAGRMGGGVRRMVLAFVSK